MSDPRPLPTLDVVVPYYNEEGELADCIEHLMDEAGIASIILVNNNSTDTSATIAQRFSLKDKRIILVDEPRRGVQFARDTGIATARADIVARIDADTRVQPGWSEAIRRFYATRPDMVAASGAYEFYDLPFRRLSNFMIWLFIITSNRVVAGNHSLYGANMSVRRKIWEQVYEYIVTEPGIMEDLSIALAIDRCGYKVGYIRSALAYVSGRRMRTSPQSFRRYNSQWWRTYDAYGYHIKARVTRVIAALGSTGHLVAVFFLRFHDPTTDKFSLKNFKNSYNDRIIP